MSEKTDVWGLGATLYNMAALKEPFEDCTCVLEVFDKMVKGEYEPLSEELYSPALISLIMKMLATDPADRPSFDQIKNNEILQPYLAELEQS